jgi:hypothetical protein
MATSTKKYFGGCHCGTVRWEAELDLSKGTGRCNCSICWKAQYWGALIKPAAFRLLAGDDELLDYTFNSRQGHNLFCRHCGIRSFSRGHIPEIGGDFVSINIACIDGREGLGAKGPDAIDILEAELSAAPMRRFNGRHDDWGQPPTPPRAVTALVS